ncbi:MAG: aminopeptidase P family protein [Clostridium sp.]|nr:aminopeptidase P family protein [Clostridium sp.]
MKEEIISRINLLRAEMKKAGIDATIVPQTDPHQSEYIASHWQVRRWLSGFTGSAGSLVVTADQAWVWADSRYWLQAREQLEGTGIGVMEEGKPEVPTIAGWLLSTLPAGSKVGVDGFLFSIDQFVGLRDALAAKDITLVDDFAPADRIWKDRPALPDAPIFIHSEEFEGESARERIATVLNQVTADGADAVLISDLAEVAWALNIRSSDVRYNPVTTGYLLVSPDRAILFVDLRKVTPEVQEYLTANGVETMPYVSLVDYLKALPEREKVLFDSTKTSWSVSAVLGRRAKPGKNPVTWHKGCKNPTQIASVREAMIQDGHALVGAFMEIERRMAEGIPTTEMDIADILVEFRSRQDGFKEPSFGTIAGFGPHGAIVHYEADPTTNSTLTPDNLLLIDSGGNYLRGTTDITRTITLGNPTPEQRHDFTLVMRGHISLATAVFPEGTRGDQLDALARIPLWREGLSYLHGTGHGVGFFLNCHEGPQSIRLNHVDADLRPGMITSDEPGLYREGRWGIRCENLILTVPAFETEFGRFYRFEPLTLFPFDVRLLELDKMTDDEIRWLNDYHHTVFERLSPGLTEAQTEWLRQRTAPVTNK